MRIGIHTSIAGDLTGALESAHKLGCNALQIFSASPRMWVLDGTGIAEADAARFRARRMELGLGPLVIHANYLINLAASDSAMRVRSIRAFRAELLRGLALGADFLVVHPGSGRGNDQERAILLASQALRMASKGTQFNQARSHQNQTGSLRILIENTSGMGSAIGVRFEELRSILNGAPEIPLGICLDTAHAFEAGYDIHTEQGLERTIAALDSTVGLARVYVVHTNDSKTPFGSRTDRHEHIGRGAIGLEAFRRMLNHPRLSARAPEGLPGRAFILETPIDVPGDDRRNVRTLWELTGLEGQQVPEAKNGFSMLRAVRKSSKKAAAKTRLKKSYRKRSKPRTRPSSRPKPRG